MLESFAGGAEHIILATGATDFRKQITSLFAMLTMQYHMDPFAEECQEELREMFDVLTIYMYENLDDFGTVLAADGKAIQSFATRIFQKDSRNRVEKDADWCKKTYTTTKKDGEKITKTKMVWVPSSPYFRCHI